MAAADEDLTKRADLRARHGAEIDASLIAPNLQGISAAFSAMERSIELTDPPPCNRHGVANRKRAAEVQVEAIQLRAFAVSTLLGVAELIAQANLRHLDALGERRRGKCNDCGN